MGHTEMVLAVAGLDKKIIDERNRRLAGGDWSAFTPAERAAFAFAWKQSTGPASVTAEDFGQLVDHFGAVRAVEVVWWSSRCHYMTRVADAFQLPLERDNVFDGFRPLAAEEQP
jgi:alkylhydroperoxidase family enzyme